jgi:hypothetical protein
LVQEKKRTSLNINKSLILLMVLRVLLQISTETLSVVFKIKRLSKQFFVCHSYCPNLDNLNHKKNFLKGHCLFQYWITSFVLLKVKTWYKKRRFHKLVKLVSDPLCIIDIYKLTNNCQFANTDNEILTQVIQNCKSNRLRRRALKEPDKILDDLLFNGSFFCFYFLKIFTFKSWPTHFAKMIMFLPKIICLAFSRALCDWPKSYKIVNQIGSGEGHWKNLIKYLMTY